MFLQVKAIPSSSRNEIKGLENNRLKVRVAAVPEDNKANDELINFFSKILKCAKKDVSIYTGKKSRLKTIALPLSAKENLEELIKCV